MRGVQVTLKGLQPVAIPLHYLNFDLDFRAHRRLELRKNRDLMLWSHKDPNKIIFLKNAVSTCLHAFIEIRKRWHVRRLQPKTTHIEFPAMVKATNTAISLRPSKREAPPVLQPCRLITRSATQLFSAKLHYCDRTFTNAVRPSLTA